MYTHTHACGEEGAGEWGTEQDDVPLLDQDHKGIIVVFPASGPHGLDPGNREALVQMEGWLAICFYSVTPDF